MATQPESDVSAEFPFELHRADILGSGMAYVDTQPDAKSGSGPTALFLHGNVSSSYLWRNIIPQVAPAMRCVAPDLIGQGHSSKPANFGYRFTDHYTFLSAFIKSVIPSGPILLIVHDWGSALGLHWAFQQAELTSPQPSPRVLGLALMEFVRPVLSWDEFGSEQFVQTFKAFRTPDVGRQMIIEQNMILNMLVHGGQIRKLSQAEIDYYSQPFLEPASREPLYVWPNQIPIERFPSDVHDIATRYHDWLLTCDVPKLLFYATPGAIINEEKAKFYLEKMKNVTGIHLGPGAHFVQEDHPKAIGKGIHDWVKPMLTQR